MIIFNSENNFVLDNPNQIEQWLTEAVTSEGFQLKEINFIFCDDEYLHKINKEYLNHDNYTDVIGFDYTVGKKLHGDIFVSTQRVKENAGNYGVDFNAELFRVLIHGVLHFCGYSDKSPEEKQIMTQKENEYLALT